MTEDDRRMTERTTIPTYSRSDPPDPVEPYKPNTIRAVEAPDGRRALELRVNIAGRDRTIVLTNDELEGHGLSGPAAVDELRAIRVAVEALARAAQSQDQ